MLEKLFGFDRNVTRVRTEVLAGITTFLTMAYILAVNPNILSATGMDKGALFTTTVIASAFATLLMAFYAKLPFGLAPGMGLNAFFAYTVCLTLGYSWQFALTAVLLEGIIFILLTVTNLRVWGIERSVFSMVGKNGQKVLKTKGFRHGRENGLNISKRFFSLHGLTSALRLRGFSSDIRGIALHRACRWG